MHSEYIVSTQSVIAGIISGVKIIILSMIIRIHVVITIIT